MFFQRLFGSSPDRKVKAFQARAAKINALEPQLEALSDEALRGKTEEFRAFAISTCRWSAAWCFTGAAFPKCAPARARPWWPPCRSI